MLSRVAGNVYWFSRYIERAENIARIININSHLLLDLPQGFKLDWESLLRITGSFEAFYTQYKEADERSVMRFLIANEKNPASLMSSLAMARENFRTTRDIIPTEATENINDLYLYAKEHVAAAITRKGRFRFLNEIISASQMHIGLLASSMLRDDAYSFIDLARNLERADMTTRILDARSVNLIDVVDEELTPFHNIQWLSLLKSVTAYQAYRRIAHSRISGSEVLRFMLHNPNFPRSVLYCLNNIERCLDTLPNNSAPKTATERLKTLLMNSEVDSSDPGNLMKFMDQLQVGIGRIHTGIDESYFLSAHTTEQQQTSAQSA